MLQPSWGQSAAIPDGASVEHRSAEQLFVRGLTAQMLNNTEQAVHLFEESLRLLPNQHAVMNALAEVYAESGDLSRAIFFAEQALNLAPQKQSYYGLLHRLYDDAGDTQGLARLFTTWAKTSPDHVRMRELRADYLAKTNKNQEAIADYKFLLDRQGPSRMLYFRLFQSYKSLEDTSGMIESLEGFVYQAPEEVFFIKTLANLYQETGETQKAITLLEEATEMHSSDTELFDLLTQLFRETGQEERANDLLNIDADWKDRPSDELLMLALTWYEKKDETPQSLNTSSEILEQLLQRDDANEQALLLLASIRMDSGQYEEAGALFYRLAELEPRDTQYWSQSAWAYLQAGLAPQAAETGREALLLFPGNRELLRVTAYAELESNQVEQAIVHFKEALLYAEEEVVSDREQSDMLAALGMLYARTGEHEESDIAYAEALALRPDNAVVLNNFAYNLAQRGVRLDEAHEYARRALSLETDNPGFMDTMGWVQFKKEEYQTALTWFMQALDIGFPTPTLYEHIGDTYQMLGDVTEARNYWQMALELSPGAEHLLNKLAQ